MSGQRAGLDARRQIRSDASMSAAPPLTLVKAWAMARDRLGAVGIDGPVIDARLLLEAASGATRTDILADPHRPLTGEQTAVLEAFLARRENREPVSHILGRKGF